MTIYLNNIFKHYILSYSNFASYRSNLPFRFVWHVFCTFIQDVRCRTKMIRKRTKIGRLRDKMPDRETRLEILRDSVSKQMQDFKKGTNMWIFI